MKEFEERIGDLGKMEEGRFTCPCCFRLQERNPENPNILADHAYELWGYRKGSCDGAIYAPLEDTPEGNMAFLAKVRKAVANLNRDWGDYWDEGNVGKQLLVSRQAKWQAREIEIRSFLWAGMKEAGSYRAFLDQGMLEKMRLEDYGAYIYGKIAPMGFDWLAHKLALYLRWGHASKIPFFNYLQDGEYDSFFDFCMSGQKGDPIADPVFGWLKENVSVHEFLNAVEALGRAGIADVIPKRLKSLPGFRELPAQEN